MYEWLRYEYLTSLVQERVSIKVILEIWYRLEMAKNLCP